MKREIGIGFLVGLISNTVGVLICTFIIAQIKEMYVMDTFNVFVKSGNLWMLLCLGALPNLLVFFGFLRINRDYRARGVLMATLITAISAYLIYFI